MAGFFRLYVIFRLLHHITQRVFLVQPSTWLAGETRGVKSPPGFKGISLIKEGVKCWGRDSCETSCTSILEGDVVQTSTVVETATELTYHQARLWTLPGPAA